MASKLITSNLFTGIGGLNLESSVRLLPDGDAYQADNVLIGVDGSISRRPGFKLGATISSIAQVDAITGAFGDPEQDNLFASLNYHSVGAAQMAWSTGGGNFTLKSPSTTGIIYEKYFPILQTVSSAIPNLSAGSRYILQAWVSVPAAKIYAFNPGGGVTADLSGVMPLVAPRQVYLASYNQMAVVCTSDGGNGGTLNFSAVGDVGTWGGSGVIRINFNPIDVRVFQGRLYVFGTQQIMTITGTSPTNLVVGTIQESGSTDFSILRLGGRIFGEQQGLLVIGTVDGVKQFNGREFDDLSKKMISVFRGSPDPSQLVWALNSQDVAFRSYVCIPMGIDGSGGTAGVTSYIWDRRTGAITKWITNYLGGIGAQVYVSRPFNNGFCILSTYGPSWTLAAHNLYDTNVVDEDQTGGGNYAYLMDYRTKFYDYGTAASKRFKYVDILASGTGTLFVDAVLNWNTAGARVVCRYAGTPLNNGAGTGSASVALTANPTLYRFWLGGAVGQSLSLRFADAAIGGTPSSPGTITVHSWQLHANVQEKVRRN